MPLDPAARAAWLKKLQDKKKKNGRKKGEEEPQIEIEEVSKKGRMVMKFN